MALDTQLGTMEVQVNTLGEDLGIVEARVRELEKELAEVKEHSEANLMASTDLGMNSMGTNEALLMTITDIGMAIMDIQKQLDELKGDK